MVEDLRVCFVGDSFVAGIGDPGHLGWVGRLAAWTEGAGQRMSAYNLGVRRDTSADVLARWEHECRPRLPAGCDARVVVSFGVNDTTWVDSGPRVAAADSLTNLRLLLQQLRDRCWPVMVVGPPAVDDQDQNARIRVLDGRFQELCSALEVAYVGLVDVLATDHGWCREVAAGDGAHPGAEGYQRIAELAWPSWSSWLGLRA